MVGSARLRQLLSQQQMVVAPGAYDGLTAKLVEQAGFSSVYMTGAGTSLARGYPDLGLVTMTEMVDNAGAIARTVNIPVVADADTGYGNELNVTRTVQEYLQRGVAAIHLEDQVAPKRCGHMEGKQVTDRNEYLSKIRAAVRAKDGSDFYIIARTDARGPLGWEEAVSRANLALEAGADMAFVEAPESLDEIAAIPRRVSGPCMLNIAPGGKGPLVPVRLAEEMGYRLAIAPGILLMSVIASCDAALKELTDHRYPPAVHSGMTVSGMFKRFGADEWDALRQP